MRVAPHSLICAIAVASLGATEARAQSAVTVEGLVISEPVYRGVSESAGRPALGINVEWSGTSDFFVSASARAGDTPTVQQREHQLMAVAGWQRAWSEEVSLAVSVSHRMFPGATKDWDSTEIHAAIGLASLGSLELSYSPDYYEHDTRATTVALRTHRSLSRRFFVSAEAGAVEMSSARWPDYQYATVGLGFRQRQLVTEARSSVATNEGANLFGEPLEAPRLVVQLSYLFR